MKHIKNIILVALIALGFSSCEPEEDFLQSDFNGVVTPNRIADFDLLLNGVDLVSPFGDDINPVMFMSDNIMLSSDEAGRLSPSFYAAYIWNSSIYETGTNPNAWTTPYNNIFTYNTILAGIDGATDATISQSNIELANKIKAEALLGRAYEHLILVNLFAQPYSAESATTPGIPYMTFANVAQPVPSRETLEITYSKIKDDLLAAIPNLPEINEERTRGSKIAAYGLLARMSLYMGNFDDVLDYTNMALDINSDYQDYTPFFFPPFTTSDNPDNIYSRGIGAGRNLLFSPMSDNLAAIYGPFDSRSFAYYSSGNYGFAFFSIDHGISTPELILNKAEALVRTNKIEESKTLLMEFQAKRDPLASPITSTDKEEVLTEVLKERRRELIVKGLRFYDMRRLQLEGRIGTIEHATANAESTATLEEGSPRYTLAIPSVVIAKNPGMEQNPR